MSASTRETRDALLVLADGTVFEGEAVGAEAPGGVATGEVVFNTVLSGYQEVLTDPSYAGQIVAFTCPHIGNYGVTDLDNESARPHCRGVVVRDLARRTSNWRATGDLNSWLVRNRIPAITGVDTRRLTRHIRNVGAMPAAFGIADQATLLAAAAAEPGTDGIDMVASVTVGEAYFFGDPRVGSRQHFDDGGRDHFGNAGRQHFRRSGPDGGQLSGGRPRRVVAYDFGIKTSILRQLSAVAAVEVVPASTSAADVLARCPDGVFLSNGPGDPAAVVGAAGAIAELLGQVPVFGICLGHQLLATAMGGITTKLPFGHHGGNHPVKRVSDGLVEITSQNHNYAVVEGSVAGADVTHLNLNDGVVEGLRCRDIPAFSVQYHPEAGPGPHDARYLFAEFAALMDGSTFRASSH